MNVQHNGAYITSVPVVIKYQTIPAQYRFYDLSYSYENVCNYNVNYVVTNVHFNSLSTSTIHFYKTQPSGTWPDIYLFAFYLYFSH